MSAARRTLGPLLDRPWARRVWKGPMGRRLRATRWYRRILITRKRRLADRARHQSPSTFDHVHTICVMLGHTKSGGSLLGAMLDAHPSIVLGDEVDILELCDADFTPDQIFRTLERSAQREASNGRVTARRMGGYSLSIPGWQGRHDHPTVVGVSRAGPTTRVLGRSDNAVDKFLGTFADYRTVTPHVVRRPHDSIAAMVLRSGRDLNDAIEDYARQCERLERLRHKLPNVVTVHYQELTGSTSDAMSRILEQLSVDLIDSHLDSCVDLIDQNRTQESELVDWDPHSLASVAALCQRFDFLAPYRE